MNDHRTVGGKKSGDLALHALGDRANQSVRIGRQSDEIMRVPWNRGVLGDGKIVSIVDCPVDQVARPEDRGRPRVDRALVASSEENEQGLGEDARQGRLAEIASPGHRRLSQLLSPLVKLHCVLDVNRTLDRVRDRRLIPQRLVLVVVRGIDRYPVDPL